MGISFDTIETRYDIDEDGFVINDIAEKVKTNKELKEDYGLKKSSDIGKEWYEQVNEFEKWAIGKTVSQVLNMYEKDEKQEEPLYNEVQKFITIDLADFLLAMENAYNTTVAKNTEENNSTAN